MFKCEVFLGNKKMFIKSAEKKNEEFFEALKMGREKKSANWFTLA